MTTEDVDKETGPWLNTEVAGAGGRSWNRVRGSLALHILQVAGGARPLEGTTGSCVDAAERGVMTWRFV